MRRFGRNLTSTDSSLTATSSSEKVNGCSKAGEAVGGTAALICCFPCAVINLVVLAVYKVPSGLCKRAWRRKKRSKRRRLLKKRNSNSASFDGEGGNWKIGMGLSSDEDDDEGDKLEEEMWGEFYRGFWRSPSQKGD
ncbi:hypothetical protein Leryth_003549 [Lithospermum erythrorhizon]|nr:hypothetical protein Leryth_003549 [Lithospermum erythrorhizon]